MIGNARFTPPSLLLWWRKDLQLQNFIRGEAWGTPFGVACPQASCCLSAIALQQAGRRGGVEWVNVFLKLSESLLGDSDGIDVIGRMNESFRMHLFILSIFNRQILKIFCWSKKLFFYKFSHENRFPRFKFNEIEAL
jgi:hypothetical protein